MSKNINIDAAARARAIPKAPVAPAARGPEVPKVGCAVEEIGDGLFWVADGVFQMMFVVSDEGVMAVDAPPSLGHNILRAIHRVTSEPVSGLVYSHAHGDHVGAGSVFPDGIPGRTPQNGGGTR